LWILVAYGNVALLKEAKQQFADDDDEESMNLFLELLRQPNKQGDSPLLATCSQGNTDMVRFLKEELLSPDQFNAAISESNHNGTTPLQIIVGNNHASLLEFVLRERGTALHGQFLECNKAGLSLFHICSERNAHEILRTMLTFMTDTEHKKTPGSEPLHQVLSLKDKNGANALHIAAFCGNTEAVQVWIDVIKETAHSGNSKDTTTDSCKESTSTTAISMMLDLLDGQGRTAYWLGMVRGRDAIGKLLADEGVDTTSNPKMVKEIEEAQERRTKADTARQQPNRTIDGSALLDR
jgi:ankyrin repeat protein